MEQGQQFKALYASLGFNASEAAQLLQVSTRSVQNWVSGVVPVPYMAMKLLRLMLRHGAEVNKPGWTPLHYAATNPNPGCADMVRLLIEENAYIDAASPNDTTPLMMAARYGHPDSVRALIELGADVSLRNQQGLDARDFALLADRRDIADLLTRALHAKQGPPSW